MNVPPEILKAASALGAGGCQSEAPGGSRAAVGRQSTHNPAYPKQTRRTPTMTEAYITADDSDELVLFHLNVSNTLAVVEALETNTPIPSGAPRSHVIRVVLDDLTNIADALTATEQTAPHLAEGIRRIRDSLRVLGARVDALAEGRVPS